MGVLLSFRLFQSFLLLFTPIKRDLPHYFINRLDSYTCLLAVYDRIRLRVEADYGRANLKNEGGRTTKRVSPEIEMIHNIATNWQLVASRSCVCASTCAVCFTFRKSIIEVDFANTLLCIVLSPRCSPLVPPVSLLRFVKCATCQNNRTGENQ